MIENRLDIVLKYLYFRSLASGIDRDRIEDMYRRHILLRTGGVEPQGQLSPEPKNSVEAYVTAAGQLFESMSREGFRADSPVSIGPNNLLANGAHRLACAMALGLAPAVTRVDQPGFPWDFQWFEKNGFSKPDLLKLLEGVTTLLPTVVVPFIVWAPVVDHWDDIVREINRTFPVVGHVDLAFPSAKRHVFDSLVYDIYAHGVDDYRQGFDHIHRKLSFLSPFPGFMRIGCAIAPLDMSDSYQNAVNTLKTSLRAKYAGKVAVDKFVTIHMADSPAEAQHISATLFNPDNLAWASWRSNARPRDFLLDALTTYKSTLRSLKIDGEDTVIVGSGILEPLGVRFTTDIDFTMHNSIRAQRFGPGVTKAGQGVDIVTENYHRRHTGKTWTDSEIIANPGLHLRYLGHKFVAPWIVRDRKEFSGRPKDRLDVELIDGHFDDMERLARPWRAVNKPEASLS